MNMNMTQEIPKEEIHFFKEKVTRWLTIDNQIDELQKKMRDLKKIRDKELEPEITKFMLQYKINDLNTDNGKLRCHEAKTKKAFNKNNIRENLSKIITDTIMLEQAMTKIVDEREVIIKHSIKRVKK